MVQLVARARPLSLDVGWTQHPIVPRGQGGPRRGRGTPGGGGRGSQCKRGDVRAHATATCCRRRPCCR